VWPTYLFVAGSIILLQLFWMSVALFFKNFSLASTSLRTLFTFRKLSSISLVSCNSASLRSSSSCLNLSSACSKRSFASPAFSRLSFVTGPATARDDATRLRWRWQNPINIWICTSCTPTRLRGSIHYIARGCKQPILHHLSRRDFILMLDIFNRVLLFGKRRLGSFDSRYPSDSRLTFRQKHVEAIRCNLCSLKLCWGTAYNFLRYGRALNFVTSSRCKENSVWPIRRAAFDYLNTRSLCTSFSLLKHTLTAQS